MRLRFPAVSATPGDHDKWRGSAIHSRCVEHICGKVFFSLVIIILKMVAAIVQGHLEKLSSNAKSIHHVLEALCGGLDRLEKKIDTNSSQVQYMISSSMFGS